MRTAVDTSVLLDVLADDEAHGDASADALHAAFQAGKILACDVVWAEVAAHFATQAELEAALGRLHVIFDAVSHDAAGHAGRLWRKSRKGSRAPRERVVADFLVGAHALSQAEALLTRDRGFYRRCFQRLKVIDPSRAGRGSPFELSLQLPLRSLAGPHSVRAASALRSQCPEHRGMIARPRRAHGYALVIAARSARA